jgi:hypothetical protein
MLEVIGMLPQLMVKVDVCSVFSWSGRLVMKMVHKHISFLHMYCGPKDQNKCSGKFILVKIPFCVIGNA